MKYIATIGEQNHTISVEGDGAVSIDGNRVNADLQVSLDGTLYSLLVDGKSYGLRMQPLDDCYRVQIGGELHDVEIMDERTHRMAGLRGALGGQSGDVIMKAPMPGVIVEVPVSEGDEIAKGDTVIVLESMKMHNEFKAPRDGRIHSIRVEKGQPIEKNAVMLTIS